MKQGGSIGIVKTEYFTLSSLRLESGEELTPVTIAYETYGELNEGRTNAILVLHAFSGDAHAAGYHEGDSRPGWWNNMIGPDKPFDTNKYFVICSNVLGGCKGSTGPSSVNPATGKPYGLDFPVITIADMVNAQKSLVNYLGIDKLLSVAGGSMGGMQVLQWSAAYPDRIWSAIPIATTGRHSPQQIAFNEVARQSIMADPNWDNGGYYGGAHPDNGLAVARMIGHITYMSDKSMEDKFGRKFRDIDSKDKFKFRSDFEVEGYLRYQGNTFVERFDANSYLYISKAMDYFDVTAKYGSNELKSTLKKLKTKFLVISFNSDWLYPVHQTHQLVRSLKLAGVDTTYCDIDSTHGHDSFLTDIGEQAHIISFFLKKVYRGDNLVSEYEYEI